MHFPEPALIAMVGAAGSGKSTAAKAFPANWRLELDALRAIAAGNCGDQSVNPVINNVFRELLDARLERRLSVVVDATNTKADIRAHLLQRARTFGDHTPAGDTATTAPENTVPDIADTNVLLPWAEQHPLASVRAKAARIRQDLADLNQRLATEQATAEAEDRIAKLRADLRAEEERLRQLKAGGPRAAAVIEAPTPIRPAGGKRSREEPAAIRTWARANGHQVAAAGVIKASIVEAYDDAHQEPATLAKAG